MILQKRRMGKLILGPLAACSTLVIGMYVYLAATDHPNHFWRKASTARITVNGQLELRARAYRHPDGKVLVARRNVVVCLHSGVEQYVFMQSYSLCIFSWIHLRT